MQIASCEPHPNTLKCFLLYHVGFGDLRNDMVSCKSFEISRTMLREERVSYLSMEIVNQILENVDSNHPK